MQTLQDSLCLLSSPFNGMDQSTDSSKHMFQRGPLLSILAQTPRDQSILARPRALYSEMHLHVSWRREDTTFGPISTLTTRADRSPSWPMATNYWVSRLQRGNQIISSEKSTP